MELDNCAVFMELCLFQNEEKRYFVKELSIAELENPFTEPQLKKRQYYIFQAPREVPVDAQIKFATKRIHGLSWYDPHGLPYWQLSEILRNYCTTGTAIPPLILVKGLQKMKALRGCIPPECNTRLVNLEDMKCPSFRVLRNTYVLQEALVCNAHSQLQKWYQRDCSELKLTLILEWFFAMKGQWSNVNDESYSENQTFTESSYPTLTKNDEDGVDSGYSSGMIDEEW